MPKVDGPILTRRHFLRGTGAAGLFVFFKLGEFPLAASVAAAAAEAPTVSGHAALTGPPDRRRLPEDFNAFLRIGPDGRVTCTTGKIEMGQGVHTSLQQMLAEELDVALDAIDIVMGDTTLCPWDMGTFGSMTTRFFGPPLRQAGAQARQALIELASEKLKLPVEKLSVEYGVVFSAEHRDKKISYGELARGKRIVAVPKGPVVLKRPSQFKVIGQGIARKDGPAKVTGTAKFAADIIVPDMLYAKILRPPAHGAKFLDADTSEAQSVEGVTIVRENDFIAILHRFPDVAATALAKVKARFSESPFKTDERSIFDHLVSNAPAPHTVMQSGQIDEGVALAKTKIEKIYFNDYVAHAPIEPHAATVRIEGKSATVWASTQTPFVAQEQVARELGFAVENVRVMPVFLGGGFGGKSRNGQILEAARCARLVRKPVQVAWTRAEEFFFDSYRPAAVIKVRSGLNAKGRIAYWDYEVYFAGDRGADIFYEIPNVRSRSFGSAMESGPNQISLHPFAVGPWRAPGNNSNTFARESQIDMLADAAKVDPVRFRLLHLPDSKRQRVLQMVAEKSQWKEHRRPARRGRGVGVACGFDAGTFVAMVAEVEVDKKSGEIQVTRVVCAQDMGLVINPRGARAQMEGSVIMGLGYSLRERLQFKNGQIMDLNFGSYEIPRFSWLPKIETYTVDAQATDAQGGGEPTIVTVGAALANAVYDATGARLLQLPMTPERVKATLKGGAHA